MQPKLVLSYFVSRDRAVRFCGFVNQGSTQGDAAAMKLVLGELALQGCEVREEPDEARRKNLLKLYHQSTCVLELSAESVEVSLQDWRRSSELENEATPKTHGCALTRTAAPATKCNISSSPGLLLVLFYCDATCEVLTPARV